MEHKTEFGQSFLLLLFKLARKMIVHSHANYYILSIS